MHFVQAFVKAGQEQQAAQGSSDITVPGKVKKHMEMWSLGTCFRVDIAVLGQWLGLIFASLILCWEGPGG